MSVSNSLLRSIVDDGLTVNDLINIFASKELWRGIDGYDGYMVSSYGRIRGKRSDILRQATTRGYAHVSLSCDGNVTSLRVHKLVALAFLGAMPFDGAHAAHTDGDRKNNVVSNLRWVNATDNQADVARHGNRVKGSDIFGAVLKESDIPKIRSRIRSGERYPNIAADFGVSISTISLIKLERTWKHV